ncbi:Tox-REase-5 domain-containing protein [Streptomyces sp. NPDC088745]|uniref:Tox-REase-5 domain-containing protein n=1 Tax=Streptomyces sp. NPDC088745 TaxID=3365884 RepID=UPI003805BBF8
MTAHGGIPAEPVPVRAGPAPSPPPLPFPVAAVRALAHLLFACSLLGGLGLLGSGLAVDGPLAALFGLVLYGAAPGVAGMLLARRVRTGGRRVRGGLVAVQLWLVVGAVGNAGGGSGRGFAQLVLPLLTLWFLTRAESREWFRRPGRGEVRRPRGWRFSLPRMIRWRRDRGQSTVEYAGLVVVIAGIVLALTLTGFGGRIVDGLRTAVCSITSGADCGGGGGGDVPQARPPRGGAAGGSGGADAWGAVGGAGAGGGGPGGGAGGIGGTGGAGETGGAGGVDEDVAPVDGLGPEGGESGEGAPGEEQEPEARYDVPEADPDDPQQQVDDKQPQEEPEKEQKEQKEEEEDCSGWGVLGCAADKVGQVFQGVVVDGIGGDVSGFFGLFSADTWTGIGEWGEQIGGEWAENAKDAPGKWADGDYLGAVGDWAGATGESALGIADDLFVGDEVRERWNNGQKTRAVANVAWNIGSLFIPGYDVAKVAGKFTHLGRAAKGAAEAAEAAGDAGAAAQRARRAAEAGDVEGARKAAREADEAADRAEDRARRTGCPIALPYAPGVSGMSGVPGSGTGLVAAAAAPRVRHLADEGCDTAARKQAEEARKQERAAYLAQKRAEEPARAAQAVKDAKKWPEPKHGDKKDPRNYQPGAFAKNLKTPAFGDADLGDGYWAGRDRNPAPTFKNESWLRYQEQITGTVRGREYVVPHPEKGKRAVEFDGWDSGRQVFLEAKNGYDSYLSRPGKKKLTTSGADKFVAEAQGQLAAANGKTVEWHFSNKEVAAAARKLFASKDMPIVVKTTKREPGGPRKPDAFD